MACDVGSASKANFGGGRELAPAAIASTPSKAQMGKERGNRVLALIAVTPYDQQGHPGQPPHVPVTITYDHDFYLT